MGFNQFVAFFGIQNHFSELKRQGLDAVKIMIGPIFGLTKEKPGLLT